MGLLSDVEVVSSAGGGGSEFPSAEGMSGESFGHCPGAGDRLERLQIHPLEDDRG